MSMAPSLDQSAPTPIANARDAALNTLLKELETYPFPSSNDATGAESIAPDAMAFLFV
jgi:hypothetical protein